MQKVIDLSNRHPRVKGEIVAHAWARDEMEFRNWSYHKEKPYGRQEELHAPIINNVTYGFQRDNSSVSYTLRMTVKKSEQGWHVHGQSYSDKLTDKARRILWELLPKLAQEIEEQDADFFIQAEIDSKQEAIRRSDDKMEELQQEMDKEQADIDNTRGEICALEMELNTIQSEKLSQLYEKANRLKQ